MIFYGVVRAAREHFGHVGPSVADAIFLGLDDDAIFVFGPWRFFDVGVEMIVPTLSTLFANAS